MPGPGDIRDGKAAAQALEALVIRQLLQSSGAFKPSQSAGGSIYASEFVEVMADAVARAGGLGIAATLERALPGAGAAEAATAADPERLVAGGGRVTSDFGRRKDPLDGADAMHAGVDVSAAEGTPILSAAGGVVRSAGDRGGYGLAVEIDHGAGVTTLYAHTGGALVKPGDRVEPGQPIATVGQTGRATGPHLHFEVRREGRPVDPGQALKAYARRADEDPEVVP